MIVPNWLKNFISLQKFSENAISDETTPIDILLQYYKFPVNQLTLAGFEIEDITHKKDAETAKPAASKDQKPRVHRSDIDDTPTPEGFGDDVPSFMAIGR